VVVLELQQPPWVVRAGRVYGAAVAAAAVSLRRNQDRTSVFQFSEEMVETHEAMVAFFPGAEALAAGGL
jgi:hypothetical protein